MNEAKTYSLGSAISGSGGVYVRRQEDIAFQRSILDDGRSFSLVAPLNMGKTSMALQFERENKIKDLKFIYTDIQSAFGDKENFQSESYDFFSELVRKAFKNKRPSMDGIERMGVERWFGELVQKYLKANSLKRVVWFLDEFDWLARFRQCNGIINDFFSVVTSAAERFPCELQFVFIGTSPFYMVGGSPRTEQYGAEITLSDFLVYDDDTIDEFAEGLPPVRFRRAISKAILVASGGQPLVANMLAHQVMLSGDFKRKNIDTDVEKMIADQRNSKTGIFYDIEEFVLRNNRDANLLTYDSIYRGKKFRDEKANKNLTACGLVRANHEGKLEVKSRIFKQVFDLDWVNGWLSQTKSVVSRGVRDGNRRVLLINTGGTIGMIEDEDGVRVPENRADWLKLYPELDDICHVEPHDLSPVDSANIFPDTWMAIANLIERNMIRDFRGVVVAHGTDTLSFTATALAFAFGSQLSFPIVVTGAQAPPNVPYGDARTNLYRACLAVMNDIPEVSICFGSYIYRACRSMKRDDRDFHFGFESPSYPPLAYITDNVQLFPKNFLAKKENLRFTAEFSTNVLSIKQVPGLSREYFDSLLTDKSLQKLPIEGIVFECLGAGNVPSKGKEFNFIPLIKDATLLGIPVVITSPYPVNPGTHERYLAGTAPVGAGAITVGDMTSVAAEVKLRWLIPQLRDYCRENPSARIMKFSELMNKDYIGEITKNEEK